MTLVNAAYRKEIFGLISQAGDQVLHVFLDVPPGQHRRTDIGYDLEALQGPPVEPLALWTL